MTAKRRITFYDIILLFFSFLLIIGVLISLPISYYQYLNQTAQELNFYSVLQRSLLLVNLAIILMVIFLGVSLYLAVKKLDIKENVIRKIFFALHLTETDAFAIFSENAGRDRHGTYVNSYTDYKRLHNLSKKNLSRTLILFLLQLLILIFLIFSFTSLNSSNRSKLLEDQSGKFNIKQINNWTQ